MHWSITFFFPKWMNMLFRTWSQLKYVGHDNKQTCQIMLWLWMKTKALLNILILREESLFLAAWLVSMWYWVRGDTYRTYFYSSQPVHGVLCWWGIRLRRENGEWRHQITPRSLSACWITAPIYLVLLMLRQLVLTFEATFTQVPNDD